jgi:hypothetical protein
MTETFITRSKMAKRKQYDDDDGRVIAKMNVEGMPWYSPTSSSSTEENEGAGHTSASNDLSKKEEFYIFVGAMKAGCVVAALFGIAMLIVILFFIPK